MNHLVTSIQNILFQCWLSCSREALHVLGQVLPLPEVYRQVFILKFARNCHCSILSITNTVWCCLQHTFTAKLYDRTSLSPLPSLPEFVKLLLL